MTKPTKAQSHVAAKIAARYTKDCTAQVALLVPCYSSDMGPCNDCRRRFGLKREIALALAGQRERDVQIVEGARYEPGSDTHIEYVEGFKTGIRYSALAIRKGDIDA